MIIFLTKAIILDKENNLSPNFLQNSYAIEEDEDDEDNDKGEMKRRILTTRKIIQFLIL